MNIKEALMNAIEECRVKPFSRHLGYSNEEFVNYALDLVESIQINEKVVAKIKKAPVKENDKLAELDKKVNKTLARSGRGHLKEDDE